MQGEVPLPEKFLKGSFLEEQLTVRMDFRQYLSLELPDLNLMTSSALSFAQEKTEWKVPEEAKKIRNPLSVTKESLQKGKEIYEKKCALCHGDKGDGKGQASKGLNPKPTNFKESNGERMTDAEHFWKIATGRGPMPSYGKDLTEEERWHVINYINMHR